MGVASRYAHSPPLKHAAGCKSVRHKSSYLLQRMLALTTTYTTVAVHTHVPYTGWADLMLRQYTRLPYATCKWKECCQRCR